MLLGGLEAGGTKMVCAVSDENFNIVDRLVVKTTTPEETMPPMIAFFKKHQIDALGIASFGPLDLDKASKTYGCITATPKLKWCDYPIYDEFKKALQVPIEMDTDVNGAAWAEHVMGAGKGLKSCVYVTVGTGVGGGVVAENKIVHGLVHPEIGHMLLRPLKDDPSQEGFCPYHYACVEGMASGPAIEKRWGKKADQLEETHMAWSLVAEYLAQMCVNMILSFSPQKIILGGGVMQQKHLFPMIRKKTLELLGGYVVHDTILHHMDAFIVEPGLDTLSGITGALLLAKEALNA